MNPNHLHLACDAKTALTVLRIWRNNANLMIVGIDEGNGWTTFDLDCDFLDTANWSRLGSNFDLIYASYSTSLRMGELVVVRDSVVERHFLHDDVGDSAEQVDVGKLPFETDDPIRKWSDVWRFIDNLQWKTLV